MPSLSAYSLPFETCIPPLDNISRNPFNPNLWQRKDKVPWWYYGCRHYFLKTMLVERRWFRLAKTQWLWYDYLTNLSKTQVLTVTLYWTIGSEQWWNNAIHPEPQVQSKFQASLKKWNSLLRLCSHAILRNVYRIDAQVCIVRERILPHWRPKMSNMRIEQKMASRKTTCKGNNKNLMYQIHMC